MMLIPLQGRNGESMDELVCRTESLQTKQREAVKAEARLKKEKQFNRKVEINAELRALKQEIKTLTRPKAVVTP